MLALLYKKLAAKRKYNNPPYLQRKCLHGYDTTPQEVFPPIQAEKWYKDIPKACPFCKVEDLTSYVHGCYGPHEGVC